MKNIYLLLIFKDLCNFYISNYFKLKYATMTDALV